MQNAFSEYKYSEFEHLYVHFEYQMICVFESPWVVWATPPPAPMHIYVYPRNLANLGIIYSWKLTGNKEQIFFIVAILRIISQESRQIK